jgi:hypothetical protein
MVNTNRMVIMTRTKGIRMMPPPGCMISAKKDDIALVGVLFEEAVNEV